MNPQTIGNIPSLSTGDLFPAYQIRLLQQPKRRLLTCALRAKNASRSFPIGRALFGEVPIDEAIDRNLLRDLPAFDNQVLRTRRYCIRKIVKIRIDGKKGDTVSFSPSSFP